MTLELLREAFDKKDIVFDVNLFMSEFNEAFQKHQELSRTASEGKFK